MCGRYTGYTDESDELKTIYTALKTSARSILLREGEIFPTHTVPVLAEHGGVLRIFPAVWGLPGFRGKGTVINARAETADVKPTFADSFRRRRCVIPTTGYLEWSPEKRKYRIRQPDASLLWLGGIYNVLDGVPHFAVMTTAANPSVAQVHDRMPVILPGDCLLAWCADPDFANAYRLREMPALVCTAV